MFLQITPKTSRKCSEIGEKPRPTYGCSKIGVMHTPRAYVASAQISLGDSSECFAHVIRYTGLPRRETCKVGKSFNHRRTEWTGNTGSE